MRDDKESSRTLILIALSYFLVGIMFGLFLYELLCSDKSACWTALSALSTIALAVVTVLQNRFIRIQSEKNSNREAIASDSLMTLSKKANDISERMIRINEEQHYPFLSCHCGDYSISNIEKPTPNSQSVFYSVSRSDMPIYEITIRDFDYASDAQSVRIKLPITFTNISQSVITQIRFSSIMWTVPETSDGKRKTGEHNFTAYDDCMCPSAVLPNTSVIVLINMDTNLDVIKQHLFNIFTIYKLSLIIQTLKHRTSQDAIFEFALFRNISIRYNFHDEDKTND